MYLSCLSGLSVFPLTGLRDVFMVPRFIHYTVWSISLRISKHGSAYAFLLLILIPLPASACKPYICIPCIPSKYICCVIVLRSVKCSASMWGKQVFRWAMRAGSSTASSTAYSRTADVLSSRPKQPLKVCYILLTLAHTI